MKIFVKNLSNKQPTKDITDDDIKYKIKKITSKKKVKVIVGGEIEFSEKTLPIIAGPNGVESRKMIFNVAMFLKKQGIKILRGHAYKPLTFPYRSKTYKEISSGKFHNDWLKNLKKNNFIDGTTKKKIPLETIRLLEIQKESMVKQLIEYPNLYYAKSQFPLEISQRALNHLWRLCESYELWCKETGQNKLIKLNLI